MKYSTGSLEKATALVHAALVWRRSITVTTQISRGTTTFIVNDDPVPAEPGPEGDTRIEPGRVGPIEATP